MSNLPSKLGTLTIATISTIMAAPVINPPSAANAAPVTYDIGGSCSPQSLPPPDVDNVSCASIGMANNETYVGNITVDLDLITEPFEPFGTFRFRDAVTDWSVTFGGNTFNPGNTNLSSVFDPQPASSLNNVAFSTFTNLGGTWFDQPNRFLADQTFNHGTFNTYLFLTNFNSSTGEFSDSQLFGSLDISNPATNAGARLDFPKVVPLPPALALIPIGFAAIGALRLRRRKPAAA